MAYHLTRAAMAALLFFFGYQILGALILAGFWSRKLGLAGALGSAAILAGAATCVPFTPVAHVIKDEFLLAVSIYLVTEDAKRSL